VVTKKEAKMEWIDVPAADAEQTGKGEGITRVWRRKSSTTPLPAMLPTSIWTRREETGWCLCEWSGSGMLCPPSIEKASRESAVEWRCVRQHVCVFCVPGQRSAKAEEGGMLGVATNCYSVNSTLHEGFIIFHNSSFSQVVCKKKKRNHSTISQAS
jgi:hypothetical protein